MHAALLLAGVALAAPPKPMPDLTGKVTAVAEDGAVVTLSHTPRGKPAVRETAVRLTGRTPVRYTGVGTNGARPVVGYTARVWWEAGGPAVAGVEFQGMEKAGHAVDLTGRVASVNDGASFTLEPPTRRKGEEPKPVTVRLTAETVQGYAGVGPGGASPRPGYTAQVWLAPGGGPATRVTFVGPHGPGKSLAKGKPFHSRVLGVYEDGKLLTLAGGNAKKQTHDVRLTAATAMVFTGVGPDGAKPSVGYHVQVWPAADNPDVAAAVHFTNPYVPVRVLLTGRVVAVAEDGSSLTLELTGRGVKGPPVRTELAVTERTRFVYDGVGPGGARLTLGYAAKVWTQEGTTNTAGEVTLVGMTNDEARMTRE
jgi:hypothetical protein